MTRRLELGWVLDAGSYLCDGCAVRPGHMHRCSHGDGVWLDGRTCDCAECKPPSDDEMAAFRASLGET